MSKDHPKPVGAGLSDKQIEETAKMIYSRYYWEYGMRLWVDLSPKVKEKLINQVKETLDSLNILNFVLTQKEEQGDKDVNRQFLTRATKG